LFGCVDGREKSFVVRIRRILFCSFFGAFVLPALPAHCGAFLAAPGQGEVITAVSFSDSTRAFDANGRLIPIPAYQKFELGSYIEYGLSDRVTLIAQPGMDNVRQGAAQPIAPTAAGSDLGVRIGLFSFDSSIVSLQTLGHLPFTSTSMQAGLFDQSRAPSADIRLSLGHGFAIGGMPGFLDVAASHTWLGDSLPDEWHADVTLGLRPQPGILLMLASYTTVTGQSGASCIYWSWMKLQPSVAFDLSRQWAVETGFFATIVGQNAGRELGPMAALWYRF
jgi:hypothetical protein